MGRDGTPTKNKILAESKALVFKNGFSGTSIDQILDKTGITKGAFFYHFNTKNALAKALIEEFIKEDMSHMEWALKETEYLKNNPLKRLLKFVQLFIDMMQDINEPPSCLYASYTHESNQFDQEVIDLISETILKWRNTLTDLINNVLLFNKPKIEIDISSLADFFTVIFEGSFITSKALNEPNLTAKQLKHLKNYFELIFEAEN